MDTNEAKTFVVAMKNLENDKDIIDTDEKAQELYRTLKPAYQSMRKALEDGVDDLRDSRRMNDEASELEKDVQKLQDELFHCNSTLKEQTALRDECQKEVTDLRELVDTIRRWMDDAGRIEEKYLQISQKKLDLQSTSPDSNRDMKTVDRQITEMREEKEAMSNKILRLNKEMSELNQKISEVSTQATKIEGTLRDTEAKYSAELKAVERRKDLGIQIQTIAEEEKKVCSTLQNIFCLSF
jgi:predicted  nucleic acid-binding Zn-ribbon protein